MGERSRCHRAIERTIDHHADAPEYLGEVGVREGHEQRQRVGLRIEWSDQTKNDTTIGPQDFRDQAAIMFPVNTSGAPPFQCMGQSGGTTNIWRWNAEWQKDLGKDSAGLWDVDDQYPGIFWDYYFEEPAGGVTYPDRIGRSLGPFNPGIWSGNIMSDPTLRVSSVEDLNANGFSTLTTQAHQDVIGNGVWEPSGSVKGGGYTLARPGA